MLIPPPWWRSRKKRIEILNIIGNIPTFKMLAFLHRRNGNYRDLGILIPTKILRVYGEMLIWSWKFWFGWRDWKRKSWRQKADIFEFQNISKCYDESNNFQFSLGSCVIRIQDREFRERNWRVPWPYHSAGGPPKSIACRGLLYRIYPHDFTIQIHSMKKILYMFEWCKSDFQALKINKPQSWVRFSSEGLLFEHWWHREDYL